MPKARMISSASQINNKKPKKQKNKKEDVPQEIIEKEKEIYKAQITGNKPPQVVEKIIEGKLEKFFEDMCLLNQPFIREPEKKIKDLITEKIAKFGENIVIRRFVRFQVGQSE